MSDEHAPAGDETFDTPPVDEVLQEDDAPTRIPPVATTIVGPVLVDHAPTEIAEIGSRTVTLGASARKVLNYDPRRCQVSLWAVGEDVMIGRTQAEAGVGALLSGGLAIPYKFSFCDELWAVSGPGADADATLSYVCERFAR